MNKLWTFFKNNFLTRKFITFGFIGVFNTTIHMLVYGFFYTINMGAFLSNAFAFIIASTFSYFANAYLTFKPKNKTATQFSAVLIVFLSRLLISSLLAAFFDFAVINWFNVDYAIYPLAKYIAPFFASALLIPVAFLTLNVVFKRTSDFRDKQIESRDKQNKE
ncbi:MAG: GtrA family protein [Candidatus Izimaplasma sp.]|nr:GtrA family protein [Candidatus Izimaplasma bacterium]